MLYLIELLIVKMGKSYVRRHFYQEYDIEYDKRHLQKINFGPCQKHGLNLIVKRGVRTLMCHCGKSGCIEEYDFKEKSKTHFLKQLVKYEMISW